MFSKIFIDPQTNVTINKGKLTGEIALAHLKEFPDYYTRLHKMAEQAINGALDKFKVSLQTIFGKLKTY